jgi:hypothetical protein
LNNIFPDQTEHFQDRFVDHFSEILANKKLFFSVWKNLHLSNSLIELTEICEQYDFVFFHTIEPLQMSRTIVANQELENFKYRDKLIFICSDQSDVLIAEYHQWCTQNNFTPLKIFQYNFISSYPSYAEMNEADILKSIKTPKTHYYLCLNNNFRWHRAKLVSDLYTHNLQHKGFISLGAHTDRLGAWHRGIEELIKVTDDPAVFQWYEQEKQNIPYCLDVYSDDPHEKFAMAKNLLPYVQHTCFSLVTEVWFGSQIERADAIADYAIETWENTPLLMKTNCMPSTVYVTEKSFKNFSSGLPFVVLGKPHTVKWLTQMGFDMYSEWIDHSYDAVENNQLRYQMLLSEVKRLCSIPLEDWQAMLTEMTDTIIKNYKRWQYTSNPLNYNPISPPELLREYVDNV